MEHQSFNRPEPIPKDVQEYLRQQPDPPDKRLAAFAIDRVRCAGWWDYDNNNEEE